MRSTLEGCRTVTFIWDISSGVVIEDEREWDVEIGEASRLGDKKP